VGGRISGTDFVEPMILQILKNSLIPMSTLAINYWVNENCGKIINLNVIKNNLAFLVDHKKISQKMNSENRVSYYNFIL